MFKMFYFSVYLLILSHCCVGGHIVPASPLLSENNIKGEENIRKLFIEQPLDHFNSHDKRTFKMFYFEQLKLWTPGGPIFLFLNDYENNMQFNEELMTIESKLVFYNLAFENNGALYLVSRRFTPGSTIPNENMTDQSFNTANQSIADLANLIRHIKSQPHLEKSEVVVMGTGIEGTFAVWLRMLHPDLVDAAYVSGARLLASEQIPNFGAIIGTIMQSMSSRRYEINRNLYNEIRKRFKTAKGRLSLHTLLGVCQNENVNLSLPIYQESVFVYFVSANLHHYLIDLFNDVSPYSMQSPLTKLMPGETNCIGDFESIVKRLKNPDFIQSFVYSHCMEFGHFATTSQEEPDPFGKGLSLLYHHSLCSAVFNIDASTIASNIAKTNQVFGGLTPNVTRVLFVDSEFDPYRALGPNSNISAANTYWFIPKARRYADVMITKYSSKEALEARWFVRKTINSWFKK